LNGVKYAGEQIAYKDSTYELVSKVAYLIGVPLRIFQNHLKAAAYWTSEGSRASKEAHGIPSA